MPSVGSRISLRRAPGRTSLCRTTLQGETLKSCPFFSFKEQFIEALAARRLMDKRVGTATV